MFKNLPIIRSLRLLYDKIYGPMPLDEFRNYDDYWDRRATTSPPAAVLHRYEAITDRIQDGQSVADIGCGDGAFLRFLKKKKPASVVFGADVSQKAVDFLTTQGIDGRVVGPGSNLRNAFGRDFEVVVLMEVIEHVHDAEDLFRQVLELNPRRIFVTIPNTGYFLHRLRLFLGGRFPVTVVIYHMKEHIRFWTVKDFKQWSATMGCRVVQYRGQERTANPLRLGLLRLWPSLFAGQLIYEIEPCGQPDGASGTRPKTKPQVPNDPA